MFRWLESPTSRVFHIAQTENSEILNLWPRKTFLKPFGNLSIVAEMKKARRVDGPSIFCFCLIPFLRKTTNSWTQRRFRNFKSWRWFCTVFRCILAIKCLPYWVPMIFIGFRDRQFVLFVKFISVGFWNRFDPIFWHPVYHIICCAYKKRF